MHFDDIKYLIYNISFHIIKASFQHRYLKIQYTILKQY